MLRTFFWRFSALRTVITVLDLVLQRLPFKLYLNYLVQKIILCTIARNWAMALLTRQNSLLLAIFYNILQRVNITQESSHCTVQYRVVLNNFLMHVFLFGPIFSDPLLRSIFLWYNAHNFTVNNGVISFIRNQLHI